MDEDEEKGLQSLKLWQKAIEFAVEVCRNLLPKLPAEEKWVLASQLRRAVQSIPANIAEGYGRYYYQESVRFCYIARGSLEETYTHVTLAYRLGYLTNENYRNQEHTMDELRRMLHGYISYLKQSKRGLNTPGSVLHEFSPLYEVEPEPILPDPLSSDVISPDPLLPSP
jgi:four helix bundle protein